MGLWKNLFGGSPKTTTPSTTPPKSIAPAQSAEKTVGPKASRIYIFSTVVMNSDERQEALWGGFFAKHAAVDRSIAEYVQIAGGITYVEPKWQKGGANLNLEHADKLGDNVLDGLFHEEHKGGCYLDALLLYPEKTTVLVVISRRNMAFTHSRIKSPENCVDISFCFVVA